MSIENFGELIAKSVKENNWRKVEEGFNASEFGQHFGYKVVLDNPDEPRCELNEVKDFHLGGVGQAYVNGAVVTGMFDLVIGLTALKYSPLGNFATTNVNVHLVKPTPNERCYAVSRETQKIGNRVFAEATLYNHQDEPCGYATGEIRVGIK